MLFKYPPFQTCLRTRLLFKYPVFLLGKNQDCYSNILCFYLTQIRAAIQISSIPTQHLTQTAIQISSTSTCKKSGQLFRYPLFLPDLRLGLLFRDPLFLLDKNRDCCSDILCSFSAQDQDYYSNILCFYFVERKTSIQIFFISTRHKSGMLFKYPPFQTCLRTRLLFKYLVFLLGKNQDWYLNILYFYLTQIENVIQISSTPTQPKTKAFILIISITTWHK